MTYSFKGKKKILKMALRPLSLGLTSGAAPCKSSTTEALVAWYAGLFYQTKLSLDSSVPSWPPGGLNTQTTVSTFPQIAKLALLTAPSTNSRPSLSPVSTLLCKSMVYLPMAQEQPEGRDCFLCLSCSALHQPAHVRHSVSAGIQGY